MTRPNMYCLSVRRYLQKHVHVFLFTGPYGIFAPPNVMQVWKCPHLLQLEALISNILYWYHLKTLYDHD